MKCLSKRKPDGTQGYALVFVLFLMALIIIGSSTAALDTLTEGRRQKEAEMIWRGKQYQRAIGLYYKKFGRFPTSIDDLVKAQNGEVRFLREAYKNPMNKEDGTWRFIYVTPAGQLIGSVQYVSLQQMALLDQQRKMGIVSAQAALGLEEQATGLAGTPGDTDNSDNGSGAGAGAQAGNNPTLSNIPLGGISAGGGLNLNSLSPSQLQALQSQLQGLSPQQVQALESQFQGQVPPQLQSQLQGQNSSQTGGSPFLTQPGANPTGGIGVQESSNSSDSTDENGQVIGGFIIGVAGKQDKPSIKVYKGGKTYKRWEFIFNPLEQVQTIGTISSGPTSTTGAPNGPTSSPMQPPQIPQQPQ